MEITNWVKIILDSLYDGVLIADKEFIVKYINPSYTRITKVEAKDIIGESLLAIRPGARLPHVIRNGEKQLRIQRKEGNIEYVVNMAPIIEDDQIIGGISILNEITDVYKLSEELNKSNITIQRLKRQVKSIEQAKYNFDNIISKDETSIEVKSLAKKIAITDSNVLITGESGTGKELYASSIHNGSYRKEGPFIAVNCASFEGNLLESEIFGYEEGAFTGARKGGKIGLFELADGGTLFLDEVSEIGYGLQAKLLRVLQEGTIRPIGGLREKTLNVRIIAATNKKLENMITEGKFREDLYYRVAVIPINIPPLRERKEDIKPLVKHFINELSNKTRRYVEITNDAMNMLLSYPWPGNIRELKNTIEFASNMTDDCIITPDNLPKIIQREGIKKNLVKLKSLEEVIREAEAKEIRKAILIYGDTVEGKKKVAKALDISLATLYNKLK